MSAPRIALVSCGAKKLDRPAHARELYTSNLFRLSAAYAAERFDRWYVVSAVHGLVDPETEIRPYDRSLSDLSVREREAWCSRVIHALMYREQRAHFTVLGGGHYRELAGYLRWTTVKGVLLAPNLVASVEEPLAGLGIGQRMAWLKGQVEP